jgi:hypothetical protein
VEEINEVIVRFILDMTKNYSISCLKNIFPLTKTNKKNDIIFYKNVDINLEIQFGCWYMKGLI